MSLVHGLNPAVQPLPGFRRVSPGQVRRAGMAEARLLKHALTGRGLTGTI